MKQQQQQPQDIPKQDCLRCGGKAFVHTAIVDPATSRTHHMFRCKACDHQQWTPPEQA